VQHEAEIDDAISAFTVQHDFDAVLARLQEADVPAGPIYSIADIMRDPQYLARNMFESIELPDGKPLKIPAVVPKLSETPAKTEWRGPTLGEHNREVYGELLGFSDSELAEMQQSKLI
jgi:formyl-CoA transferase